MKPSALQRTIKRAFGCFSRVAGCLLLSTTAFASPETYNIDPAHTFPRFALSHFGFSTHHGQFNQTSGKLRLDLTAGTGSIDVTVQTSSVSTGDPKLEEHLRSADFFNVQKFPVMTFKASNVRLDSSKTGTATGELTLLGVTKPLSLTIASFICGLHPLAKKQACGAQVTGIFKRSDFGMTAYAPAIGDEVTLTIQVESFKE